MLHFYKMHGLGNDFVIMDMLDTPVIPDGQASALALRICERRLGVGADGLVFIEPSLACDYRMRIFNSDGSEAGMCGNATRCIGKYLYESGRTRAEAFTLETRGGPRGIRLTVKDGAVQGVTVDMGQPILDTARIPALAEPSPFLNQQVRCGDALYTCTLVSMGNPHCVIPVSGLDALDLTRIGPPMERHSMFPDRCNIEFIEVIDPQNVRMRVWERGAGETMACGTGACATAVACALNGWTGREVDVRLLGGTLRIHWDERTNHVFMTGSANWVFDGDYRE